ncbi:uncharacterized protein LOC6616617 isoform X1 [Drosophila sechellia]|uniref:uncharacterized protein LOC6616617 isoform X1 n=1 Tax=Drosophila sechellia TaxID=7238 RepID=UPI0013DE3D7C|nr:uncharacterized protein LOC6616617 isoform X1 [Drosophila sechellia]
MQYFVAQCFIMLILAGISQQGDDFSTPSAAWLEYQRERFGMSSNPFLFGSTKAPIAQNVEVVTPKVETTSRKHSSSSNENASQESEEEEESTEPPNEDEEIGVPSVQGFFKFLKNMQKTWIKKSTLTFGKKIKLLQNLRDNLIKLIEQQFAVLWQPPERRRRRRRGILDDSEIDFPPEAAIMSINFLTFAVFLIKLVMQVVKIVKSKHVTFSGFTFSPEAARRP